MAKPKLSVYQSPVTQKEIVAELAKVVLYSRKGSPYDVAKRQGVAQHLIDRYFKHYADEADRLSTIDPKYLPSSE